MKTDLANRRCLTLLVFSLGVILFSIGRLPAELPAKLKTTLNQQVIPFYLQGDSASVLRILSPLMSRLPDEVLLDMDAELERHELPELDELLASARTALIRQPATGIPRPSQRELLLVLPVWHAELSSVLDPREHPEALTSPPPRGSTMELYEEMLWDLHVLDNRLHNAGGLALQISQWTEKGLNRNNLNAEQARLLDFDYQQATFELKALADKLNDQDIRLRAQRMEDAVQDLEEKDDYRTRLLAAFALATDARLLADYFKSHARVPDDGDTLTGELAAAEVAQLARRGERAAGEQLLLKSRLLFEGMHWWLRGRYGHGSEGGGLFKSKQVIKSPQLRFGLYMPTEPPRPTVPALKSTAIGVPQFDRRHHFVWAWENQGIELRQFQGKARVTSGQFY